MPAPRLLRPAVCCAPDRLSSRLSSHSSARLRIEQGWRPLYRDPKAPPGSPVSRHHAIGIDEHSGVVFICGGKWSTYRAMAEELIDKVIGWKGAALKHATSCKTRDIKLLGGEGYHDLLYVQLVQNYGVSEKVAKHLCHTYGSCAFQVCELAGPSGRTMSHAGVPTDGGHHAGRLVVPDYPYIESEVIYACKYEMVNTVKDMLTTRMRLAYINSEAAKQAIPRVADLMASTLKWSKKERDAQVKLAHDYIGQFGGPIADKSAAKLRSATFTDLHETFVGIDLDGSGYIDEDELNKASIKLGFPFRSVKELKEKFAEIDTDGNGKISEAEFVEWWNGRNAQAYNKKLHQTISLTATGDVNLEKLMAEHEKLKKKQGNK